MFNNELLTKAGEHSFSFKGAANHQLEAALIVPENFNQKHIALLGHPHSLQGGTMQNKVVTTLARTYKELGIASIRFNFRGVGASEGKYDNGQGESEDMLTLVSNLEEILPNISILFAGFSFGSYVAYRSAAQYPNLLLITVAPPVHHYDYTEFSQPTPWIVVQGDKDEVVPAQLVYDFCEYSNPPLELLNFFDTGHFFHGKLIELKDRLVALIPTKVSL